MSDAIRHPKPQLCSLFGKTPQDMLVDVTIGVPNPNGVDTAVAKELPCGTVKVTAVKGGLEVGAGMKDFDDAQELLLQLSRRRINNVRLGHPAPGAFNSRVSGASSTRIRFSVHTRLGVTRIEAPRR